MEAAGTLGPALVLEEVEALVSTAEVEDSVSVESLYDVGKTKF